MMQSSPVIRVAVVDDSQTMRDVLTQILSSDERLEVVATASDASDARNVIKRFKPDVLTLDIDMPGMDGLEFLKVLMRARPMPVVMCSSHIDHGSQSLKRALQAGAVDFVRKPRRMTSDKISELCEKVFDAAHVDVVRKGVAQADPRLFLIGASTGGVEAIEELLKALPAHSPPIVIAQHMPEHFLGRFLARLDAEVPHDVNRVKHNERLDMGQVRFAPRGAEHTEITQTNGRWLTLLCASNASYEHTPSVDHLFLSAEAYASDVTCVILTGIGCDGTEGIKTMRAAGARTFGQSEPSCAVYGMPRSAKAAGGIECEADIPRLAELMMRRGGTKGDQ